MIEHKSILPFAEYIIRKMVVTHVSFQDTIILVIVLSTQNSLTNSADYTLVLLVYFLQSGEPSSPPLAVTQFHYTAWPDHGVPSNAFSMIKFIRRVRKSHPYFSQDVLLVHCSAGVGRTGAFITLDSMLDRLKEDNSINIYDFVSNLRRQRVLMVQTLVKIFVLSLEIIL